MQTSDLVFIGIKGSVVALNRATGQQVWATHLKGAGFVNVLVEDEAILASCSGEIFCLDRLTGNGVWHNPLKGYGMGLTSIATSVATQAQTSAVLAEARRHEEAAAAAAAA